MLALQMYREAGDLLVQKGFPNIPQGEGRAELEKWCTVLLNKAIINFTTPKRAWTGDINSLAVIASTKPS